MIFFNLSPRIRQIPSCEKIIIFLPFFRRLSILVQYSFYKNVATFTCQFFYAIFSNWSGQTLYDSMFLFMYNTIYACIPIVIFGLSEQDYPKEVLLSDPTLYAVHR